ncbi:solute carrier family 23 member 2-like [Mytilus californianus]|uniref:solute carrier family 23 member 2-like n=1 Tax=Mytilus californianus TaxID=6549 RepID=UPI002246F68C|nr:solute carrier family 23 member 2-like [Mytilus californianus]
MNETLNTESLLGKRIEIDEFDANLAYDVDERPPWFVTVTTAFQHTFLCVGAVLAIVTVLSDVVCADLNDPVRSILFSSSILVIGLSTAIQSYFGLRLPVFQGASSSFMVPLIALQSSDTWKCPSDLKVSESNITNVTTSNISNSLTTNIVYSRLTELQGSLIAASMFEVVIGLTGLIGLLMKFISPITIGVTLFCLGYSLYPVAIFLCKAHWGISLVGCGITVLFSVYMSHIKVTLPNCNRKSEKKSKPYPVFQVFPVLFTLIIMWVVCAVCTKLNVFSNDPDDMSFKARTDVRNKVIQDTPWILIPYPGQFGTPKFNTAIFLGFLISVITSVIESVGDYIATARVCHAYPVPRHALNRGIAIEGIFSVISGTLGTGHATTSYSTTVSLLGLTKIGSRIVLVVSGIMAVVLAIIGKFGAVMTSVPDPVLGGITFAMLGVLCSLGISALQNVELRSSRNLSVIGISLYFAVVFSEWQRKFPDSLKTDSDQLNQIVKVTIGNAMFIGFIVSLIMDNTVRGTDRERGILNEDEFSAINKQLLVNDDHVIPRSRLFDLPFVSRLQNSCKPLRHVPFLQPYIDSYDVTVNGSKQYA